MNDLIDPELGNQNIEINNVTAPDNSQKVTNDRDSKVSNNDKNISKNATREVSINQVLTKKFTEKAKDKTLKTWLDKYICCFN